MATELGRSIKTLNFWRMIRARSHYLSFAQFWLPLLILALFGVYHGLITFVNHANFQTNAFDLGYYNHAVYEFGHFRLGRHVLEHSAYWHTWGDHFEPILVLFGPLTYIFDNLTMLVVQWASILIGAIGVLRYFQHRTDDKWLPVIAMAQFLSIWANSSALSFDVHASVLGAMCVPWMLLFFHQGKRWAFAGLLLLFVASGEKISAWGVFIFLGLVMLDFRDRRKLAWALGSAAFCLLWTVVSLKWVIPYFLNEGEAYRHFAFRCMGENNAEVLKTMITNPGKALRYLFLSHLEGPEFKWAWHVKLELWKMILLSGGIAFLRRPQYLFMLLPVLLSKLYNDATLRWGINAHYSIELVPILSIALYEWVKDARLLLWRRSVAIFLLIVTLVSHIVSLSIRDKWDYGRWLTDLAEPRHWNPKGLDPDELNHAISLVPPDVPVTASDRIVPHIPLRRKIYFFPTIDDAEYAVIQRRTHTYPLDSAGVATRVQGMMDSGEWGPVWDSPGVTVLRRIPGR